MVGWRGVRCMEIRATGLASGQMQRIGATTKFTTQRASPPGKLLLLLALFAPARGLGFCVRANAGAGYTVCSCVWTEFSSRSRSERWSSNSFTLASSVSTYCLRLSRHFLAASRFPCFFSWRRISRNCRACRCGVLTSAGGACGW